MFIKRFLLTIFIFICLGSVTYSNSIKEVNTNNLLSMIANSKGQVVVLNFWASWCPYCKRELKELSELKTKYSTANLKILGVSFDSSASSYTKILEKSKINYPNYLAADRKIALFFNIVGVPVTIVYDKNGRVAKQFSGYVKGEELEKLILRLLKE